METSKNSLALLMAGIAVVLAFVLFGIAFFIIHPFDNKPDEITSSKVESASSTIVDDTPKRSEKVSKVFSFKSDFTSPDFQKKTFYDPQNGNVLPYRLYIPEDYNSSKKYPVILFLHGLGEVGTDNEIHIRNIRSMFLYNGDLASQAIIVCPQSYEWWYLDRESQGDQKGTLGSALHLLDEIKANYSCDSNRIYVTGLSMGGYATWELLQEYGDVFAAGMPICGGGDSSKAYILKDIPIKIYHSKDDPTVSFSSSLNMYNAIVNAGGQKISFVRLDGLGHNSWDYAYGDREAFCWMLAQNKANNPSGKYENIPYFRVVDENGEVVISDEDIENIYMNVLFGEENSVTVDISLNNGGQDRLTKAYKTGESKEFVVYWSVQKIYTFTVDGTPEDNTFSIVDVFNNDTGRAFFNTIKQMLRQRM